MEAVEALREAVRENDGKAIREILRRDPGVLERRLGTATDAPSPILEALYRGAGDALAALLDAGPELDVHEAAALGEVGRLGVLLDADPDLLPGPSADGWTPLHLACFFDRPEAVRLLLDRGAPVDATSRNATANRPLHAALAGGARREIVEALLETGAEVTAQAAGGYTPLHLAASRGAAAHVELLLARGADPGARAEDGSTAAGIAEERGHPEVAARLR